MIAGNGAGGVGLLAATGVEVRGNVIGPMPEGGATLRNTGTPINNARRDRFGNVDDPSKARKSKRPDRAQLAVLVGEPVAAAERDDRRLLTHGRGPGG